MPATDASVLDLYRARMFRWRAWFVRLGLPAFITWTAMPFIPRVPGRVANGFGVVAFLAWLALTLLVLWSLFRFAPEAGGTRYALGHSILTLAVAPLGVILIPLLVDWDATKRVAAWRRATAPPAWFVAVDSAMVLSLLGMAVVLTAALGLMGMLLGAVLVPLMYGGFRFAARPESSEEEGIE